MSPYCSWSQHAALSAAAISGGGSPLQICLEPPACNLKQQNPFWLNFPLQDKAGPVLSQLHSHSALLGSYLQCPGSQLLRISAAQTSPACTSHSSLPRCQLQLASIMGLMYTTLALAPAMREGRAANGKQSSDDMRWSCAHSGKKIKKKYLQEYAKLVGIWAELGKNRYQKSSWGSSNLTPMLSESDWIKTTLNGGHSRWVSQWFLLAFPPQARTVVASRNFTRLCACISLKATAVDALGILL